MKMYNIVQFEQNKDARVIEAYGDKEAAIRKRDRLNIKATNVGIGRSYGVVTTKVVDTVAIFTHDKVFCWK